MRKGPPGECRRLGCDRRDIHQVLSGLQAPRSRAHYAYVALELIKVAALVPLGILLLSR